MFARNRAYLTEILLMVRQLELDPWKERMLGLEIQEKLISGLTRCERRITTNRATIDGLRTRLRKPNVPKAQKLVWSRRIARLRSSIEEQKSLKNLYRDIGDAIAFIYLDRFDLKPLSRQQNPGNISGKKGARLERAILRKTYENEAVAILNDLTTSIRFGDLTLFFPGGGWRLIEAKSGRGGNKKRGKRQVQSANKIIRYLQTDVTENDGEPLIRFDLQSEPTWHVGALNQLTNDMDRAEEGWAVVKPEPGVVYAAVRSTEAVQKAYETFSIGPRAVAYVLNDAKGVGQAFLPFSLAMRRPETVVDFFEGAFVVMVFVDFPAVGDRVGLEVCVSEGDWPLGVREKAGAGKTFRVGRHMMTRCFAEQLSPRWLVEFAVCEPSENDVRELAEKFERQRRDQPDKL